MGGLEHLSGNLSFPNSKMKALDLVTFTCHFGEGISHSSEYVGWGYEKEGCQEPRGRGHEQLAGCKEKGKCTLRPQHGD